MSVSFWIRRYSLNSKYLQDVGVLIRNLLPTTQMKNDSNS